MNTYKDRFTKPTSFILSMRADGVQFRYEPGNGTGFDVVMITVKGGLLVAIPNFNSSYIFSEMAVHSGYVQDKLGLKSGDAEKIAELINVQFNPSGAQICDWKP